MLKVCFTALSLFLADVLFTRRLSKLLSNSSSWRPGTLRSSWLSVYLATCPSLCEFCFLMTGTMSGFMMSVTLLTSKLCWQQQWLYVWEWLHWGLWIPLKAHSNERVDTDEKMKTQRSWATFLTASGGNRIQTQVRLAIKFELLILVDPKLTWGLGSKNCCKTGKLRKAKGCSGNLFNRPSSTLSHYFLRMPTQTIILQHKTD